MLLVSLSIYTGVLWSFILCAVFSETQAFQCGISNFYYVGERNLVEIPAVLYHLFNDSSNNIHLNLRLVKIQKQS